MQNLSNIGTIKDILSRHGFTFSKALGQNFLVNPSVCPKMAELSGAGGIGVIEIGTGIGVLTAELAEIAKKVVCIELDTRLMAVLSETLADFNNIKIINDDVLKVDLAKVIEEEFGGMEVVVCANLPYYITSPIIMSLLEQHLPIKAITVMVQKEAAQRLCAMPATRDVGAVTIAVRYYSEPKILFNVSRGSFMPVPDVDSCVIKLDVLQKPSVAVTNEKLFFTVVKAAFSQRRKTIPNCLAGVKGLSKAEVTELLEICGVSPKKRAEQLTMDEFKNIANAFAKA